MRRLNIWIFGALAVAAAAVFVKLGFWQLSRLSERRARNAIITERAAMPPLDLAATLGQDTTQIHWRHVRILALADYDNEIVHATRSQNGSPGVHLLTPIQPLDSVWGDTAVILNRGFVYSANARTIDYAKTREGDTISLEALVLSYPPAQEERVTLPSDPRAVRALNHDSLSRIVHHPLANFILLALGDTVMHDIELPARVTPPPVDEGPHMSYALQWFSFAIIGLVGFVAYVLSKRKSSGRSKTTG